MFEVGGKAWLCGEGRELGDDSDRCTDVEKKTKHSLVTVWCLWLVLGKCEKGRRVGLEK